MSSSEDTMKEAPPAAAEASSDAAVASDAAAAPTTAEAAAPPPAATAAEGATASAKRKGPRLFTCPRARMSDPPKRSTATAHPAPPSAASGEAADADKEAEASGEVPREAAGADNAPEETSSEAASEAAASKAAPVQEAAPEEKGAPTADEATEEGTTAVAMEVDPPEAPEETKEGAEKRKEGGEAAAEDAAAAPPKPTEAATAEGAQDNKGASTAPSHPEKKQGQGPHPPYPMAQGYHPHYYHRHPAYAHHPQYAQYHAQAHAAAHHQGQHHPQGPHQQAQGQHGQGQQQQAQGQGQHQQQQQPYHAHWTAAAHHAAQQYAGYYRGPPPAPHGPHAGATAAAASAAGSNSNGAKPQAVPQALPMGYYGYPPGYPGHPQGMPPVVKDGKKSKEGEKKEEGTKAEEGSKGVEPAEVPSSDGAKGTMTQKVQGKEERKEGDMAAEGEDGGAEAKDGTGKDGADKDGAGKGKDTDSEDTAKHADGEAKINAARPSSTAADEEKDGIISVTAGGTNGSGNPVSRAPNGAAPRPAVAASSSWSSHPSQPGQPGQHPHPHGHPHHPYYAHHYGWHHAHHAAARAGYHHYQKQQQAQAQGQQAKNGAPGQQPPQQQQQAHPHHPYPYWPGYHHPHPAHHHAHAHHHQQQAAAAKAAHQGGNQHATHHSTRDRQPIAWTASHGSGGTANTAAATAGDAASASTASTVSRGHKATVAKKRGTSSNASVGSKKRHREEDDDGAIVVEDARDDVETGGSYDANSAMDEEDGSPTSSAGTMSLGGFSMGSIGRIHASSPSGKRQRGPHRSQSIHRSLGRSMDMGDESNLKLLEISSTLSEGKMILKNLSINSSYSAEFADLCGPSPTAAGGENLDRLAAAASGKKDEGKVDEGKTPKKRNTSSRKARDANAMNPLVFRLDGMTPAASRGNSDKAAAHFGNDDSPTMFDLIGGAETPTTGMLMSHMMEHPLTDDLRSLNGHLRGQSFTPLPVMTTHDPDGAGHGPGGLSITPQLSWTTTGSPLDITPRAFGMLDSTRSGRSFWKDGMLEAKGSGDGASGHADDKPPPGGVKSILSMLSPTMREMEINHDGSDGDGNPLPLYYEDGQENGSAKPGDDVKTPLRRPPVPLGAPSSGGMQPMPIQSSPWGDHHRGNRPPGNPNSFAHSPIPHPHGHGAASPYRDGPPPPHHGYHGHHYPPYHHPGGHHHYNPNDRVRNLRGNGPPRHQMPPQHHLPPPSYHHFSPLTNVAAHHRARYGPHRLHPHHLDMASSSKRKCVPLKPPIPSKFQGDPTKYRDAQVPEFNSLVNFPGHMTNKPSPNVPDGMRCCVMCGQACPCSQGGKKKVPPTGGGGLGKSGAAADPASSSGSVAPLGDSTGSNANKPSSAASVSAASIASGSYATIPTQNKGLCTVCDVNVWIVTATGLEIKWCKGCKNFRPWAAFGDKGLATKCVRCRERQREKYALQKNEKERARGAAKARKDQRETQKKRQMQQPQVRPAVA